MLVTSNLKELYEIDDYLWLEKTIKLLKNRQFSELDLDNLIEELDALGNESKNRVKSLLEQIIRHLLLLEYWTEELPYNSNHWQSEILSFRYQLNDRITTNFKNMLANDLEMLYGRSLKFVETKTGFKRFPKNCPYTLEQLLDENYLP